MNFTEQDLAKTLREYGGDNSKLISEDPKLFKYTFDFMKAVAQPTVEKQIIGIIGATANTAKLTSQYSGNNQTYDNMTQVAAFVGIFKISLDMTSLNKIKSPAHVGLYVASATIQKIGIAVAIIPDDKKAKCIGAVLELAGSAVITGLTAPTGVLLWLSLASLTSSVMATNNSCKQYYPDI